MIFTEVRFVLFVIGCWVSFFAAPRRFRSSVLAGWGVAFYLVYAAPFAPLVFEMIFATYLIARNRADLLLVLLIAALWVNFKAGIDLTALSPAGVGRSGTEALIIPLGFSFLAFELMHLAIECRRGRIVPPSLVEVVSFALFFPCRIAGPIKRYPTYRAAVDEARPSIDNVYRGIVRILVGIFKKVVIADFVALTAAEVAYADTPLHVWKAVFAYSLRIYFDFSAYSDMAIGFSQLLGIAVPENFNWPYLSPNIQEFWNRWHMTLSGWARDYVFTPSGRALFKTRIRSRPALIAATSYLATFLVIGAWHGLTPNFLVWGLYHGILVTAYYLYRRRIPASVASSRWFDSRPVTIGATLLTFLAVTIGWVPFMTTLPDAVRVLRLMMGG